MTRIYRIANFAIDLTCGLPRYDTHQGLFLLLMGVSTTCCIFAQRLLSTFRYCLK